MHILIQGQDDLWYIKNLVKPGDLVRATTLRRMEKQEDAVRSKERSRVPVTVTISVQDVGFVEFTDRVRILGTVTEGPEGVTGEHQSLQLGPGDDFYLMKRSITPSERKLLEEALNGTHQGQAIFVVMDDEEATICRLRSYSVEEVARIPSQRAGKDYEHQERDGEFFSQVRNALRPLAQQATAVIVLGPGFTPDAFGEYLRADQGFRGIPVRVVHSDRRDAGAVYRFLETPESEAVMRESRAAVESRVMAEFMRRLSRNGAVAYGLEEVKRAIDMGAVDTLMVLENKFRESEEVRELADRCVERGSRMIIFSRFTEPGAQLAGFGGIAALLRYSIA